MYFCVFIHKIFRMYIININATSIGLAFSLGKGLRARAQEIADLKGGE